jgi:hypothetical protein
VIKQILAGSVLAIALLVVSHPAKANWLCGPEQCVWVHHHVVVPAFAATWAPPMAPSCFWRRGIFGRWRMICP